MQYNFNVLIIAKLAEWQHASNVVLRRTVIHSTFMRTICDLYTAQRRCKAARSGHHL